MDELSFGEWKWNVGGDMEKLISLEHKKHQLAERLFFLELHHQASLRQYQKILGKLGSFVPRLERRKAHEHPLPSLDVFSIKGDNERITLLKVRLRDLRACFTSSKEMMVLANHRSASLAGIKRDKNEGRSNDQGHDSKALEVQSLDDLFKKRGEESGKNLDYLAKMEKNWREIDLLIQLENQLEKKAEILCHIAMDLFSAGKWHVEPRMSHGSGHLAMHTESFSIC
jgi:hypothetical protein